MTQTTANAASCVTESGGTWFVGKGCTSVEIPGVHVCADIAPGENTAIECTDLAATDTASAHEIWGVGEFYCQGAHPQCQGMNVKVGLSWTDLHSGTQHISALRPYMCNPTVGACPNGGRAMVSTAHSSVFTDCFQLYTFLPAGEGTDRNAGDRPRELTPVVSTTSMKGKKMKFRRFQFRGRRLVLSTVGGLVGAFILVTGLALPANAAIGTLGPG
ncbi:MAG TPA: hypothetical protein VFW65_29980 [Pseudonocardiaceae bacterium]|nr:hypothetical protein [Pseudonocardiaceae bacterium]